MSSTLVTTKEDISPEALLARLGREFAEGYAEYARREALASSARTRYEALERHLADSETGRDLIARIARTPSMSDPGKSGAAAWFADENWEPIHLGRCGEFRPGCVTFEDALRRASGAEGPRCLCGGSRKLRVIEYDQTEDSPVGDTWTTSYFGVCDRCFCAVHLKDSRSESSRFM